MIILIEMNYLFWYILLACILAWYVFVTILVAIRGAGDIKEMISNENDMQSGNENSSY